MSTLAPLAAGNRRSDAIHCIVDAVPAGEEEHRRFIDSMNKFSIGLHQ